ncbi:uncharacterized protein LOC123616652 isoform X2 [Camelus bactrianus]|uniref:Uncharacterized protein LOC123616652 isoform X2 n=1 Tax=Camelus bactrianus TaxID=9837 RepID=A0AC58P0W9_CAMBA
MSVEPTSPQWHFLSYLTFGPQGSPTPTVTSSPPLCSVLHNGQPWGSQLRGGGAQHGGRGWHPGTWLAPALLLHWTCAQQAPSPASVPGDLAKLWLPWGAGRGRGLCSFCKRCPRTALYGQEASLPGRNPIPRAGQGRGCGSQPLRVAARRPPLLGAQPPKGSHISPSPSAALGHLVGGPAAEGLTGSSRRGRQAPLSPAGLSPWQEQQDCRSACPSRHHRNHTRAFAQAEPQLPRGIFSHLALCRHTLQTPALKAPGAPSLLPCAEQVLGNRGWTLGPLCPVAFTLARRPQSQRLVLLFSGCRDTGMTSTKGRTFQAWSLHDNVSSSERPSLTTRPTAPSDGPSPFKALDRRSQHSGRMSPCGAGLGTRAPTSIPGLHPLVASSALPSPVVTASAAMCPEGTDLDSTHCPRPS